MILSPVWTPARIAAPSGRRTKTEKAMKYNKMDRLIKERQKQNRLWEKYTCSAARYICAQQIHSAAFEDQTQSNYLNGVFKDDNSGYITRRTCFTAPPQTKGFRHETGYYEIHVWLYSQQLTSKVFCKPKEVLLIEYLSCTFRVFNFLKNWSFTRCIILLSVDLKEERHNWVICCDSIFCQYISRYARV